MIWLSLLVLPVAVFGVGAVLNAALWTLLLAAVLVAAAFVLLVRLLA